MVGHGSSIQVQVILLAVSTCFFLILLIATFLFVDRASGPFLQRVLCLCDKEILFESSCLIIGWSFLVEYPGIAALRLCRAFRILWFVELIFEQGAPDANYRPEHHFVSIPHICILGVKHMEAIAFELFTAKSKGGIVLFSIFLFTTYVFAMVFWIEDRSVVTPNDVSPITGNNTVCGTLMGCTITLLRLSFYDGTGFDFLGEVIATRSFLHTGLLIFYLVFTGMILLNGLVGIFGAAFAVSLFDDSANEENPKQAGAGLDEAETRRLMRRIDDARRKARAFFGECAADIDALRIRVAYAQVPAGPPLPPPTGQPDSPVAAAPSGPAASQGYRERRQGQTSRAEPARRDQRLRPPAAPVSSTQKIRRQGSAPTIGSGLFGEQAQRHGNPGGRRLAQLTPSAKPDRAGQPRAASAGKERPKAAAARSSARESMPPAREEKLQQDGLGALAAGGPAEPLPPDQVANPMAQGAQSEASNWKEDMDGPQQEPSAPAAPGTMPRDADPGLASVPVEAARDLDASGSGSSSVAGSPASRTPSLPVSRPPSRPATSQPSPARAAASPPPTPLRPGMLARLVAGGRGGLISQGRREMADLVTHDYAL